ncbi:hypothetical protein GVN18_22530 [Pseudomonas sp. ODNR1LW]|jgi:hypothetical protein|nr:hypothetical protein [Pseudomonas sp. ODNR1LW]
MSYWLPDIDIAIAGDPRLFLDRMEEIGRTSSCFLVERRHDALGTGGLDALNFRQRTDEVHRALGFQLLTHPDQPGRVAVEVRAQRWSPDPPTYAVYSEAARGLVMPLLTAFNRNHATRYRLRIERPGTGRFVISSRSQILFDRFAVLANSSSLHPRDWGRFYTLVREGRQQIPEAELRGLLREKGFSKAKAEDLAELYGHLWAFKRLR